MSDDSLINFNGAKIAGPITIGNIARGSIITGAGNPVAAKLVTLEGMLERADGIDTETRDTAVGLLGMAGLSLVRGNMPQARERVARAVEALLGVDDEHVRAIVRELRQLF